MQHRKLYSVFYNNLYGEGICKHVTIIIILISLLGQTSLYLFFLRNWSKMKEIDVNKPFFNIISNQSLDV